MLLNGLKNFTHSLYLNKLFSFLLEVFFGELHMSAYCAMWIICLKTEFKGNLTESPFP